jgi:hypothetical protein
VRPPAPLLLLGLLALGGCFGGGEKQRPAPKPPTPSPSPGLVSSDAVAIQDWLRSLNAGEYDRAASYFAKDAVVQQLRRTRLRTHRDAVNFLRDLPCRAALTELVDEGRTELATFSLSGPSGTCGGHARVRFTVERGRITEWRQLPGRARRDRQAIRPG